MAVSGRRAKLTDKQAHPWLGFTIGDPRRLAPMDAAKQVQEQERLMRSSAALCKESLADAFETVEGLLPGQHRGIIC